MKQPIANPGYDKTRAILIQKDYFCASQFTRKAQRGIVLPELCFEIWTGPKGCVMVQVWKDGNGCDVYTNWTVGHTFGELQAAL